MDQASAYRKQMAGRIKESMLKASPSAKLAAVILFDMVNADNALSDLANEIYHEYRASVFDEAITQEPDGEYLLGMLSGFQSVEIW